MGAWIETSPPRQSRRHTSVAPYMGAWIETHSLIDIAATTMRRTLYGCVD